MLEQQDKQQQQQDFFDEDVENQWDNADFDKDIFL